MENPVDVVAIERTGVFRGLYLVLGGAISPLDGVGPDELRISLLLKRVEEGAQEVILATSASSSGEATSMYLTDILHERGVKVSRIARGIPMGIDLEFADPATLEKALEGRKTV